ncbi:hypothetical protein Trydic_g13332 [Trypoxylus dichotomus]
MRLFKRRCSDPNPQLVSLCLLDDSSDNSSATQQNTNCNSSPISRSNLATWGRKVGETWEKIKRGDSSEMLSLTSGKRRNWTPNQKSTSILSHNDAPVTQSTFKKISRVESLKSLFSRSDKHSEKNSDIETDLKNDDEIQQIRTERNQKQTIRAKERYKSIADNIELTEKQLIDYLSIIQPTREELKQLLKEFVETDKENSRNSKKLATVSENHQNQKTKGKFKGVKNLFSLKSSSKSENEDDCRTKRSTTSGSLSSLTELLCNSKKTSSSLSEISAILSPTLLAKSDESGYASDSTTVPTDSPRESLKSQKISRSITSENPGRQNIKCNYETKKGDEVLKSSKTRLLFSPPSKKAKNPSELGKGGKNSEKHRDDVAKTKTLACKDSLSGLSKNVKDKLDNLSLEFKSAIAVPTSRPQIRESFRYRSKHEREFKCVRLRRIENPEDIGLSIAYSNILHNNSKRFIIADIAPASAAARNGSLFIGDEIVKLNGTRIRGVSLVTARNLLVPVNGEVEIIIARTPNLKETESTKLEVSDKRTTIAPENVHRFGQARFSTRPYKSKSVMGDDGDVRKESPLPEYSRTKLSLDLQNSKLRLMKRPGC